MKSGSARYIIRPVEEADISPLTKLINEAYQKLALMGLNYTGSYQDEKVTRNRIKNGKAFVLEVDGEIAGTASLTEKNFFTGRRTAYISQVAISPCFQRLGLGTSLMLHCENVALKDGYEAVQLDTAKPASHLVKWYEELNYLVVGEQQWDGKTYESWIFEKSLKAQR